MFKRLHHNSEFQGTGIGLALCKKIVEQHKGYISARSKINEGSTFIISLPFEHHPESVTIQ
jgi:light-regulated signal transduction histidine kinase (bacteriophytochrome)